MRHPGLVVRERKEGWGMTLCECSQAVIQPSLFCSPVLRPVRSSMHSALDGKEPMPRLLAPVFR